MAELREALFDVPNLDCLSTDPKDWREAESVFCNLKDYCRMKARAMEYRLEGKIEDALWYENECDKLYGWLPKWARW